MVRQIERFLDEHPREVLVIVFEDRLATDRIAGALTAGGLAPTLLPVEVGQPLPTLGAMIASGQRLFATLENGDGGPTLRNAFAGTGRRDAVHLRDPARSGPLLRAPRTGATTPRRCSSSTTG